MASAAPPKRMVSSVFITLASPCRATVTQQQHALQTHNAPERDVQHTAVRVQPSDSVHTQRRKKDSSSSESSSSSSSSADSVGPIHPAPLLQDKPTDSKPAVTHPRLSLANTDQQRAQVHTRGSDELVPLSPSLPLSVGTELSGDSAPPLSPALREAPSLPLDTSQSQPYNKQLPTFKPEPRTPSSGGVQDEQSQGSYNCHQEMSPESNEVCGFCRKTVALNEPAVEALNRTYHDGCFQCRQCHVPLAGKLYYNKAGIPLCEECYQASLELCWACGEVIKDHVIRALERTYHPPCFTCATCSQQIGEQRFAQGEVGEVYCLQDYYRKYAPQCSACNQLIIPRADGIDSYTVECLGRSFHEECYRCEICDIQLSPDPNDYGCYPLDGRVLCKSCHLSLVSAQH